MKKLLMALVLMPMTVMAVADNGLVHRWSFNGNLTDSVGGITAAVVGNVTTDGKQYTLAGGSYGSSYVNLGSGILPTNGDGMTLEIWARRNGEGHCSRIFDIGSDSSDYLMWSWMNVDSTSDDNLSVYALCGISDVHTGVGFAQGVEYHISVVARKTEEGVWIFTFQKRNNSTGSLIASQQVSSAEKSWKLSDLGQSSCWLGHSQWPSDDDAAASYNEVRIWNRALSESELSENVRLGPDVLPGNTEDFQPDFPSERLDSGVITNVTVRQIQPWNGLVEIQYELTEDVYAPGGARTLVICEDRQNGTNFTAKTFTTVPTYEKGVHRLIWDVAKDYSKIISQEAVFKVVIVGVDLYCVIDVSRGSSAAKFSVTYLLNMPRGGWTDEYKKTKLVLRRVDAGTFVMGSAAQAFNQPHQVCLTKPFYIGVFEVTQKQYELVTGVNSSYYKGDMRPMEACYNMIRGAGEGKGWPESNAVDADSFLGKLRAKTGLDFDLPTEAQWECACRAGTTSKYNNGGDREDDLKLVGRYDGNVGDGRGGCSQHTIVGSYSPNAWGLYDMHGNVFEWCLDWFGAVSDATDPKGRGPGAYIYRVLRGGSWNNTVEWADSSSRFECVLGEGYAYADYGFRISLPFQE